MKRGIFSHVARGVILGEGTRICDYAQVQAHCVIGRNCTIGAKVTVEEDCVIGDRTTIQAHAYITAHSVIGHDCFIAPMVAFSNDNFMGMGKLEDRLPFRKGPTLKDRCRIGVGAILLPSVVIGENAVVGAGSVVTKDIPAGEVHWGNPAKFQRKTGSDKP